MLWLTKKEHRVTCGCCFCFIKPNLIKRSQDSHVVVVSVLENQTSLKYSLLTCGLCWCFGKPNLIKIFPTHMWSLLMFWVTKLDKKKSKLTCGRCWWRDLYNNLRSVDVGRRRSSVCTTLSERPSIVCEEPGNKSHLGNKFITITFIIELFYSTVSEK